MYSSLGTCLIYGSFQGLRGLFSIPFPKDRTISRKTFDLLRLAWSNCSSDFIPLQATLIDAYSRFSTLGSTTVPSGSRTTKNICRIGPLVVSEKETNQNGTGCVRNSCVSSAPIWA